MEKRIAHVMDIPKDILEIKNVFTNNKFKLFVVGGAVRDSLLGLTPKDFDLATDALPDDVERIMREAGFSTLPTGKAFGVINVFTSMGEHEVATFRSDIGSDGRFPDSVEFTTIDKDVLRRDLTINALFFDIEAQEVVDLVGGLEDLKNAVIRTVGSAEDRFKEDKLRILRAIRFSARFGSDLDADIIQAIKKDNNLGSISGERKRDEFLKGIQSAKSVSHFLGLLSEFDLFKFIFQDLQVTNEFLENKDEILVMASLLKSNDTFDLEKKLNQSKFSSDEIKAIKFLVSLKTLSADTAVKLKRMQRFSGVSSEQIIWFTAGLNFKLALIAAFISFELTVNGEDLMRELNLSPGKELGDAILKREEENFKKLL